MSISCQSLGFPVSFLAPDLYVTVSAYSLDPLLQYTSLLRTDNELDLRSSALAPRSSSLEHAIPLRILCLGASITYGYLSTDGNGYRYALRGKLVADGNAVNMIGYVSAGNMSNNHVEGFPGLRIDQVQAQGNLSLPLQPNIVLIFLGTNDMTENFKVATAAQRMDGLLQEILSKVPDVAIIVSTLLPNGEPSAEANTLVFNAALPAVVANLTSHGHKVSMVDMHSDWFSVADLRPDGTHPTDMGYLKMARVFYKGIEAVAAAGNISSPVSVEHVDDYAAGNDSSRAGTAMDIVCQNVNSTAQKQLCSGAGRAAVNVGAVVIVGWMVMWCWL